MVSTTATGLPTPEYLFFCPAWDAGGCYAYVSCVCKAAVSLSYVLLAFLVGARRTKNWAR